MTALDDRLIPRALSLIDRFGKDLTFAVQTETYDPATGKVTISGATPTVRKGIVGNFRVFFEGSSTIQRGDTRIVIAASGLTFTPSQGLEITFDSETWTIVSTEPKYTGDEIAVYVLQARRTA